MNAIARGIYNHIPNDGREFVLTDQSAIEIQAEDGRNIESVIFQILLVIYQEV